MSIWPCSRLSMSTSLLDACQSSTKPTILYCIQQPNWQYNMKQTKGPGLKIAFIYDPKSHYLDLGYSDHECADLADSVTIDGVSSALEKLGHSVVHVPGIKALVNHLANGDQSSWDMVFNYSEGVYGSSRESQVPALLEAYQVPFTFSDAATLAMCIDKGRTKVSYLCARSFFISSSDRWSNCHAA